VTGRFGSNVYALHDEPLPLVDTLHLDPGYMAFLRDAGRHHHARVRRISMAVSASLDKDIRSGQDVLAPVNAIERRLEAVRAIHRGGERRYFNFSAAVLSNLANAGADPVKPDQDQNSKAVDHCPQNSTAASCSSKKLKTTTTTNTQSENSARETSRLEELIYPRRLQSNERALAARYLAQVLADQRQAVLVELEGRLQAERQGAGPVYDVLRYLHQLCVAVNRGGLLPNLGLKIQSERERMRREMERMQREAVAKERERLARASCPPGASPLAEIRKTLGMPRSPAPRNR
jgi:hypothetical protein